MNLIIIGLAFDIIGAILVAKSLFVMTPQVLTDFGYRYVSNDAVEFYGAHVIGLKLREQFQVRLGICLLVFGFSLQIIANIDSFILACFAAALTLITTILIGCWIVYRHKITVFNTAVELLDRMFYRYPCAPSGMDPTVVHTAILLVKLVDRQNDVSKADFEFVKKVIVTQQKLRS